MSKNYKLQPVKQLHLIYPDIQGQLCSRHSTLFGKLRTTFNKLYDNMQPQYYVIVKGNCELIQETLTELKLSLALQNGLIILTSRTYQNSQFYINSNHFSQQLIFTSEGNLQQGLNSLSFQMQTIIKDILSSISKDKQFGGIMYAHANIPQNCFNYKKTFLIAFYLSILTINNSLALFSITQLIDKMTNLKFIGTKQQIQRQLLKYKNRKFNLSLPNLTNYNLKNPSIKQINSPQQQKTNNKLQNQNQNQIQLQLQVQLQQKTKSFQNQIQKNNILINMDKNYKFLFCKLDLAKQDVNYQFRRRKQIKYRKKQIIEQIKNQLQINGLFQLYQKINQINLKRVQFSKQFTKQYQPLSLTELDFQQNHQQQILSDPHKFIEILIKEISIVSQFSNQNISIQQLISTIWEINSKYLRLHAKQVVDLVQSMKQRLNINGCMVINQNFLVIVVQKKHYTQLLINIKQKMNQGQLKSKSLFKIIQEQELIQQRWSSDNQIGQKMFTTVPSQGIAIFDPSQSIWFD